MKQAARRDSLAEKMWKTSKLRPLFKTKDSERKHFTVLPGLHRELPELPRGGRVWRGMCAQRARGSQSHSAEQLWGMSSDHPEKEAGLPELRGRLCTRPAWQASLKQDIFPRQE